MAGENNHFALVCVGGEPADLIRQRMDEALASVELSPRETEVLSREEGPAAVETRLVLDNGAARDAASDVVEQLAVAFDTACLPLADRRKRLLICDMDSTIIQQECIDELADYAGLRAEISEITERAMRGELDFEGALKTRVALLKDLPLTTLEQCYRERIRLSPGAATLVKTMADHGTRCVLVSGGFTAFTGRVAREAGFHADHANQLLDDGRVLTGTVREPILGREAKAERLKQECERLGVDPSRAMAIGDGANDLAMIRAAGLGIAYRAKPIVASEADVALAHTDLSAALYFQGYRYTDFADPMA